MLSKHCESYYPTSSLPVSSREKAVNPQFIRNIPVEKYDLQHYGELITVVENLNNAGMLGLRKEALRA